MTEPAKTRTAKQGDERLLVAPVDDGVRLDVFLNRALGWNSRGRVKEAVKLGSVLVNGEVSKPSRRLRTGEEVEVLVEPPLPPDHLLAEDLPLDVVYEDASMCVLNKQAYLSVHPGAGRRTGTLANALAFRFRELSDAGGPLRPGIVHRLDRDTTGVLCVAKTNRAHYSITSQFHERTVEKTYDAMAEGVLEFDEYVVDEPIGRHPNQPIKMCVDGDGRPSMTRFETVERFDGFTFVKCFPKTGRTHQIRVHLAHLGHPIVCDRLYGRRQRISYGEVASLGLGDPRDRVLLDRHALHASTLRLFHPLKGERITFEAPLAADMQALLDALRETRRGFGSEIEER